MEKTTVEQLIEDCYKIARLGNITHNIEICFMSDGRFRASIYYDFTEDICLATALTQLKENLIVRAKPVIEKSLQDNKSNIAYHTKCVDQYLLKIKDTEQVLQSL